jgi:hypothetical protein
MRGSLKSALSRSHRLAERLRLSAAETERSRLAALSDDELWNEILDLALKDGIEQFLETWREMGGTPADTNELRQRWNRRMGAQ